MRIDLSRQLVFPSTSKENTLRPDCVLWSVAARKVTKSKQLQTLTWKQSGGRQAGQQLPTQWRSDAEASEPPAMDGWIDRSEKGLL